MYLGIADNIDDQVEIKKSKFLTYLRIVQTEEEVEQYLAEFREQHKKATHVCYAYRLQSPSREKASDDGEPSGTAGVPMLDILKKKNITNVLAVVVRYFGGVKLGAGGLVRAYAGSVVEALEKVAVTTWQTGHLYQLCCDFDNYSTIQNNITAVGKIKKIEYMDKVYIYCYSSLTQEVLQARVDCVVEYLGDEDYKSDNEN